jgi:acyl carrier protein
VTTETIRDAVARVLSTIAPEADLATLPPGADLREALDLDSMDFLHFVQGLHDAVGVDVPEADYRKIATLDGCVAYLSAKHPALSTR